MWNLFLEREIHSFEKSNTGSSKNSNLFTLNNLLFFYCFYKKLKRTATGIAVLLLFFTLHNR